ncbi:HAD family hydrolase [Microbacterium sp. NEAU-LLC]|uniref:HAD family hydrolase n=1 Tax=Microbacterium helvum TaxID=2773713 RepID=A0ABR8NJ16_9MICO|nr:HAD family hydrolase [Microbacterium helvum]MBD3940427.1 HAD family hydrolase [Microbacterium helvum]
MTFRAVLFDWRGTLVVPPTMDQWAGDGLRRASRPRSERDVRELVARILEANGTEDRFDTPGIDADAALHRRIYLEVLADAGIDAVLSEALYASESDPAFNPFASDAADTIRALVASGVRVGVVSDIHFDIRPAFVDVGLAALVEAYALSFEVGAQKPDPAIFAVALDALAVDAAETLMVGDRSRPDGGAVECGITTLLLPPLQGPRDERLGTVLGLVG